jgi:hypothetical protein
MKWATPCAFPPSSGTLRKNLESACQPVTRAAPKDGGVASQQWLQAVFVAGEFRRPAAGGTGQSGLGGRSGGDANIEEFTERRWLTVNTTPAHYPY